VPDAEEGVDDYVFHAGQEVLNDIESIRSRLIDVLLQLLEAECVAFLVGTVVVFVFDLQALVR
jgi:hypothetical protein